MCGTVRVLRGILHSERSLYPATHRDLKTNMSAARLTMANTKHENDDTYHLHRAKPDSPEAVLNHTVLNG